MRRGLLGGTFDPPHVGHLVLADAALTQLDVECVSWVPAGQQWQKDGSGVSPVADRLQMVRLAVDGMGGMCIDEREIRRQGPSFTADTVAELRSEGVEPVLVMGADTAVGIPTWERFEALGDVVVAVAPRPGTHREHVERVLGARVVWLDAPELEISATDLRRRFAERLSTRHLVPDRVRDHILERRLYG
jgi:nicotinate-nucleotide adenylyltransferase